MMLLEQNAHDALATEAIAARLAGLCGTGDCILLTGDLGMGKTTFARGFISALCPDAGEILSPTFMLAQSYRSVGGIPVWHFDFYRLKAAHEAVETGLEDALAQGITLIEWPEVAQSLLPESALTVAIGLGSAPHRRHLRFNGQPDIWQARLDAMKKVAA